MDSRFLLKIILSSIFLKILIYSCLRPPLSNNSNILIHKSVSVGGFFFRFPQSIGPFYFLQDTVYVLIRCQT